MTFVFILLAVFLAKNLHAMGGAVQNGMVALNNASSANAVTVSTLAGSAGVSGSTDGTGTAARFNEPHGLTTDGTNLYVLDYRNHTIRKISSSGSDTSVPSGSVTINSNATDTTSTTATLNLTATVG